MSGSGHMVLVVEDDAVIREMLTDFLTAEGFRVLAVEDGATAALVIDQARSPQQLCVVLLDLMLPQLSGLDVLQHLRARTADVPVVALSASRDLLAQAIQAGAAVAVAKPFDFTALRSVVAAHCPCASS